MTTSTTTRSRETFVSPWWHWLIVMMVPVAATTAVPFWIYTPTAYIDPWIYHGFFRHLEPYTTSMFPQTYYGSRLGWIVPGYVLYQLMDPWWANLTLHVTFYLISICCVYFIVRRVAGTSHALFAACLFGLYEPTLQALGSDYVDGAVITYALVAAALGAKGVESSRWLWTLGSGAAVGAMLNSNIGSAFLLPSILVWLVPDRRAMRVSSLAGQALFWCTGIVLTTAALSIVSVGVGGGWDFFLTSFRWQRDQGWANPWDFPGISWVLRLPYLFLPVATVAGALLVVSTPRLRKQLDTGQWRALASLLLCFAIFAAYDFIGPGALLAWHYYASWLIPWTVITIGCVLTAIPRRSSVASIMITVGAIAVSLIWPTPVLVNGAVALAITVAMVTPAVFWPTAAMARVAVAAAVIGLQGWMLANTFDKGDDRADGFRVIDRGMGIIDQYVTGKPPRFLLVRSKTISRYTIGLTSVYLWGYTIASDDFPKVTAAQAALIEPGTTVVVIADHENAEAPFDSVFAPYKLKAQRVGSARLDTKRGPMYLTFVTAQSASPDLAAPGRESPDKSGILATSAQKNQ